MNLAIVIAIGDYKPPHALPACEAEGRLMADILRTTGRFENVLLLAGSDSNSKNVKKELPNFIASHKKNEIDEIFFYYTGHGDILDNDFRFLLSDYDETRLNQTTLANSEVDTMLRSLNPRLAVKVVDACHSGTTYIKDKDALVKSMHRSQNVYNKCYFMFSSQHDQSSYQDSQLSHFTEAFVRAITTHDDSQIRYQDIADFIRDEFLPNSRQTPYFVTQADLTDVFCEIGEPLRSLINAALKSESEPLLTEQQPTAAKHSSLFGKIKQDAERFCTKEETIQTLESVRKTISLSDLIPDLEVLFSYEMVFYDDLSKLPNRTAIATWLNENPHDYFVELKYKTEEFEELEYVIKSKPPRGFSELLAPNIMEMLNPEYEQKAVKRTRKIIDDYSLTVEPPFYALRLNLIPVLENLDAWEFYLTFVFSKSALRLFYSHQRLASVTWDERKPTGKLNWKTIELPLKDKVNLVDGVGIIVNDFHLSVVAELRKKFDADTVEQGEGSKEEVPDEGHDRQKEDKDSK